ncbi:transporter [Rugosimonospora acidiphila]|uniref:Transporter n=1 Tax=Rugosimonospora acidiphila TaxID=556531 RepID=A0ABP9SBQ2_9ACTN
MIWLTWRQFRVQFVAALVVLAALAGYLVVLGRSIRHSYNSDILGCVAANGCSLSQVEARFVQDYAGPVRVSGVLLMVVPAIIGLFWATPMITRELETDTHRLVWNQSVTRTRWLAVKLTLVGLFGVAATGAASLGLTWAASRFDQVEGNRFLAIDFASRNLTPLGYAAFAFALGIAVGLLVRRTVPAMAITLAVIAVVQFAIPIAARPHLRAPVTASVPYTSAVPDDRGGFLKIPGPGRPVEIEGYTIPGALMLTSSAALLDSAGRQVVSDQLRQCLLRDPRKTQDCVARLNLHFRVSYQPANRYWSFQMLEFGGFVVLAVLLVGVSLWWIRRIRG